ncbi:hypothetical protein BpHYR1_044315 [Brachionus plicatilis]|uniref:Uncharacterized protein n=1 Tax=Brachionus plicatilis TaxID=10195 RepID=A0A3M7T653_BRAPC|nr:hypothetical protein BpHYR1_044315 [Brachionus plicatilis]
MEEIISSNYKNDGRLFLNCELLGTKSICKSFYRLKVPFKIPCKTLHPSVQVTANLKAITYDPESGFGIKLNQDHGNFECRAEYDSYSDRQIFELTGISSAIRVDVLPPDDLFEDLILIKHDAMALVSKGQKLTMTCSAKIGCNDIFYNLVPIIDSTDNYRIEESRDRSACANNFYALFDYTKTIHFDSVTKNETSVSCEVTFEQSELKYTSHRIFLVFSDEQFLHIIADKPPSVDYSTFGVISYFFQASGKYKVRFFRDKVLLEKDFIAYCIHVKLFNYACYFHYPNELFPGKYEIFISLVENPAFSINQTVYVTIPIDFFSQDITVLLYRFCSWLNCFD